MYAPTLTAVALLSSLVSAQIPGLPSCAESCVGNSFGSCGALDVQCICSNTELLSSLSCCVSKACSKDDQEKTLQFAKSLCGSGGSNNLPTAATCAPGQDSGSSTTSAPNSGSSSTEAASTTTGSGTVTSSASGEESSETSSNASDETTQSSGSSTATSTDSAASQTDSSPTSSGPAESTGGVDALAVRLGSAGLGVVVAGVMAAL